MQRSRLGSLFSDDDDVESSDVLRYNAPKETTDPPLQPQPQQPQPQQRPLADTANPLPGVPPAEPKIAAVATVRLYRFDVQRGSYDTMENGSPVGCVLLCSPSSLPPLSPPSSSYQLLVYNGQKTTLVAAAVVPSFAYTFQDSYLSFSTVSPTNAAASDHWSLLFESVDSLRGFLRVVAAAMGQLHLHDCVSGGDAGAGTGSGAGSGSDAVFVAKYALPPLSELAAADDGASVMSTAAGNVPLSSGMAAGIYYTAWSLSQPAADTSGAVERLSPEIALDAMQPPVDVLKVKLTDKTQPLRASDVLAACAAEPSVHPFDMSEVLPAVLGKALIGVRKGERLLVTFAVALAPLGLESSQFSQPGLSVWRNATGTSTWLGFAAEVDVAKVRQRATKSNNSHSNGSSSNGNSSNVHTNSNNTEYGAGDDDESVAPNVYDSMMRNSGTGAMTGTTDALPCKRILRKSWHQSTRRW